MSFQSLHFVIFLISIFTLNRLFLNRINARKNLLLIASYYFYTCWDWRFAGLMLFMTAINFIAGKKIEESNLKREKYFWLSFALLLCLGVLGYFKYANFFIESASRLLKFFGLETNLPLLQLLLPIGISFFTFQSLSYSIDIFRGCEKSTTSFRDFSLFVAFFPTVLSGPITRARWLLPQFENPLPDSRKRSEEGFALIIRGFVKKMAFADVLAIQLVNPAFSSPSDYSALFLLVAVYAYSFQIYMDLSGYTDIAIGTAKLFGFELPENFNRPYQAVSVSNFWQRWHISMSSFFRDYLYFGVGGSKYGNVYVNLYITFIAIGIWHGAGWNFVLYGLIHGSVIAIERWFRNRRKAQGLPIKQTRSLTWFISIFLTFQIVAFSRILFRSPDISSAGNYLSAMFWSITDYTPFTTVGPTILIIAIVLHYVPTSVFLNTSVVYFRMPIIIQGGIIVGVVFFLMAFSSGSAPFVYFQF